MPSASNSNYCFGAKRRTMSSFGIKAIMAAWCWPLLSLAELRLTKLRGGIKSPPTPPRPKSTRLRKVVSLRSCTLRFTMP